ncbi:MAG TPA: carboxypeptidase regulatory-like domain-containing protein [Candidatus Polarisedimenticolia bacterium]|jgi:hypothetical protein
MSARRFSTLFGALLIVQGLCFPLLFAQATTSTVKGRVVDTDGSGLPGVVVMIKSKSQPSGNKQVVTDIEGNYRIPLLNPANDYYIKVDYPGFAPMELGPLDLDAGKTTVADLTLRSTAETTEVIHVESQGNIVDTEGTKTASSYSAEFIEGLPIIGKNYQDILTLAPGVTDTDGDGNPNVHGARDTGLQYRLDGGNVTDPVSGTFGQNLNSDIIEEVEVITSGASAEYGRADGGFANVITKSGGNDFEGNINFQWRGKFLNGNGALNNDINKFETDYPNYSDLRGALNLGGAVFKDKLWYYASIKRLDAENPLNLAGSNIVRTVKGLYAFGKLTWQASSYNKLALQITIDPLTFTGFGLDLGVSPDSDFKYSQGSTTPQLKWTSTISPQLLLESLVTLYTGGQKVEPVSKYFTPTETVKKVSGQTIQAQYPCDTINCNPARGEKRTYTVDLVNGQIGGPFPFRGDDTRERNSIKTDLSYNIEDFLGQHNIKAGIEFADEKFRDNPVFNPQLLDVTTPFNPPPSSGGGQTANTDEVNGFQLLLTYDPLVTPQRAASFNSGAYLLDAWKPRPNLTVNVGVRIDREDVDTSGFDEFDPRAERTKAIKLWSAYCAEARLQETIRPGTIAATSNCWDPAKYNGNPPEVPTNNIYTDRDQDGTVDVDPSIASLDLDGNGRISTSGNEGQAFYRDFTRYIGRQTSNFEIVNNNLSPRLSISWDPWADGKTKAFGNWSRYYDRLFLGTITGEIGPDRVSYAFLPNANHVIVPGQLSKAASTVSITQVDRNLRTPYTDELSIGFERELAPEWSAGITYIRRKSYDLLQDTDYNHITCEQYGEVFGIDPLLICGDGNRLETDKFGRVGVDPAGQAVEGGNFAFNRGFSLPNQAPDLYTVNNSFNQILRIGNFNSSRYEAYELKVVKRLHRNWQMQASYTWSEAFGQAETFGSELGNDPQTTDDEAGYLNFDQRHILKFQAVTRLPHEVSFGTVIQWASGTPYSVIARIADQDSTGNSTFRTFFPTGQRNDQRNQGAWKIDTHLEKNFVIGKVRASGYLNIENLLNTDDLALTSYNIAAFNGIGLRGTREFGRRFELGATFNF